MKIIVSTKQLADKLNEFDFKNDSIQAVRAENSNLYLDSRNKTVEIYCEIIEFEARVEQRGAKWYWLKDLVNKVDEQPVLLVFTEGCVKIIFHY